MNRYQNIKILREEKDGGSLGNRFFKEVKYPEIPLSEDDIYVITSSGDRYDLLAQVYYGDPGLWWVIPSANPSVSLGSVFIAVGTQLRIPLNLNLVLSEYFKLNNL